MIEVGRSLWERMKRSSEKRKREGQGTYRILREGASAKGGGERGKGGGEQSMYTSAITQNKTEYWETAPWATIGV